MTLLEALRQIKSNPLDQTYGICGNLEALLIKESDEPGGVYFRLDDELEELFKAWPDCHQLIEMPDTGFPVGGHREYREEAKNHTLWQNPKRIALLDWCIQKLENENACQTRPDQCEDADC